MKDHSKAAAQPIEGTRTLGHRIPGPGDQPPLHVNALPTPEKRPTAEQMLELVPSIILALDHGGNITLINRRGAEILECDRKDVLGKNWFAAFLPSENREQMIKRFGQVLANELDPSERLDEAVITGRGRKRTVRWRSTVIRDERGTITGILRSGEEIDEFEQTELASRKSDGRVRNRLQVIHKLKGDLSRLALIEIMDISKIQSLVEHIHGLTGIGMALLDLKGTVLASAGWQRICSEYHRKHPETAENCLESDTHLTSGVEPGEFRLYKCRNQMWDMATPVIVGSQHIGNLFLGQFFFDDEELDIESFRRQARRYGFEEAGYISALEQVPRRNREFIDRAMSFYSEFTSLLSTISFANAGLDRANIEMDALVTRLRESEQRYHSYVDNAPFGIFIVNERAEYQDVNRTGCELSGYTREELLSMSAADLVPESERELLKANISRTLAAGRTTREARFFNKSGKEQFWSVEAVKLSENRVLGFITDITERKQAKEKQEQMEYQLRQAQRMESVGRLAGGVAHDFNNLLTVITGFSELLLDGLNPKDPMRDDVGEIITAAKTAATLTEQLLAFSRRQIIAPRVIDLNRKLAPMQNMLRRLIGEDIDLVYRIADGLWPIRFDPGQVDQVLVNLVANARDAMERGGTLTVEARNVVLDGERPTGPDPLPDGEYVLIEVRDSGNGMDPETVERIFEPFFTTKEVGKGTGLGLSTVYGILEQNNSHIKVKSVPGRGSLFEIHIPRFKGELPELDQDEEKPGMEGSETILLVEDQEVVRGLAERVLRSHGYLVLCASDGGEALLAGKRHEGKIDLLLTDMVMPKMSGKALADRLSRTNPGLRVLYMSGYTDDAIARHGILEEGDNFLPKPFHPGQLVRRVRQVLDARDPHD